MIYNTEHTDPTEQDGFVKFVTDEPDSLEHHGIAGQKWGVRNGPPYPLIAKAGRTVHYNVGKMTEKTKEAYRKAKATRTAKVEAKNTAKVAKAEAKKSAKESKANNISAVGPKKFSKSKQRISEMSSEELKARIERLKLEEEYRKYLNGGQPQQKKASNGKNAADTILKAYGDTAFKKVLDEVAIGVAKTGVEYASKALMNKLERDNARKKNAADYVRKRNEEAREELKKERNAEREIRNSRTKAYWDARAKARGEFDEKEEIERRRAARRASNDVWRSTYPSGPGLPG